MGTVRRVDDEINKRDWAKTQAHAAGGGKIIIDSPRDFKVGDIVRGNICGESIPLKVVRESTRKEQLDEMRMAQVEDTSMGVWSQYFYEVQALD